MRKLTDLAVWPVSGEAFEDILDGYFPLNESVRQMMERHQFTFMRISLLHAPVMNIRGLAATEPVPLYLRKIYAGMIDNMVIAARQSKGVMRMRGAGEWMWVDGTEDTPHFPSSTRLGEPAFVRGIGIRDRQEAQPSNVAVLRLGDHIVETDAVGAALHRLGWSGGRVWRLDMGKAEGIRRSTSADIPQGFAAHADPSSTTRENIECEPAAAGKTADGTHILINTSIDQIDAKALDLSRLL